MSSAIKRWTPQVSLKQLSPEETSLSARRPWFFLKHLECIVDIKFRGEITATRTVAPADSDHQTKTEAYIKWQPSGLLEDGWTELPTDGSLSIDVQNLSSNQKLKIGDYLVQKR